MLEKLIKALECDNLEDDYWWDSLGGITEAKVVVAKARKEYPTKDQLEFLCELLDISISRDAYKECLNDLRKELIQIES